MHGRTGMALAAAAVVVVGGLGTSPTALASPTPQALATTGVTADYEMNEAVGATVMTDSSGNGLDGLIDPTGVTTGDLSFGQTGYSWSTAPSTRADERIITVSDDPGIEPGSQAFMVEVQFRTTQLNGVIVQKGQSNSVGGWWKASLSSGMPTCLFKDEAGLQLTTSAKTTYNDNAWHVLRCVLSPTGLSLYLDNTLERSKAGTIGTVDNTVGLTIGGRLPCNGVSVPCEYYAGRLGFLKVTEGPAAVNQPPTAKFDPSCVLLDCSFDTSLSSDPDGTIESYAWTFGDGATSTQANPSHAYTVVGNYQVKLVVTDDRGDTDGATHSVNVSSGLPPSRPRAVFAEPGDASATVTWKKPTLEGDSLISGYVVTADPGGATCDTTDKLSCKVTGLANGTPYTFTVTAHNDQGPSVASKPTEPVTPAGLPSAPPTVTAEPGDQEATVQWTAADGSGGVITGYVVTALPGGKTKTVSGGARKAVLTGLTNGVHYRFSVAAMNTTGTGPATTSEAVTPAGVPLQVRKVEAAPRPKSALVSWAPAKGNGSPVLRYKIVASNGKHRTVSSSLLSLRFDRLRSGTSYRFRVRAINAVGAGPWSSWTAPVTVR